MRAGRLLVVLLVTFTFATARASAAGQQPAGAPATQPSAPVQATGVVSASRASRASGPAIAPI